ncbi:pyrroline-5-carboxylate reductase [Duganella sp. FT92W]|uniref:Pyrroline-5-carboxylate reductase n=1 Tax=Pseudoduganella rivuli TaxID=2666085 RepID=A0A7X2LTM4_9BURK|nr:pyrroline-5-carboxylate reductase [Pseudoduganella rivuli]MRV73143.1 pyrroline-5-carboxylate reductase [Pseudoduganella rivuli]
MKIAFIGGGNMAAALIAGLAGKLTPGANIHVVDPNTASLDRLRAQYGVTTAASADAAVSQADVIVLAVKPQIMKEVAAQLLPLLPAGGKALLLSIAAGIRAADLSRWLGGYAAIVRTMPNTPALIGQGITGMVAAAGVSAAQRDSADAIMKAVGGTVWLDDEALIDPVTAVSGSGPAYVFYFIEAMQQAALEMGLNAEQGKQLALATFTGAAQLAAQSDEPVSVLRERVTSKGGTTYAALTSMEESGVKQAIITAMKAAAARGKQLGDELGQA